MDAAQCGYHILLKKHSPVRKPGKIQVVLYTFGGLCCIFHKISSFRPAAYGLDPYGSAAAAKVYKNTSGDISLQYIKQRFFYTVRSGPGVYPFRRF